MAQKNSFIERVHVLFNASVGVTVVPTQDVQLTLNALREYSIKKGFDFKFWTHVVGWESSKVEGESQPKRDKNVNFYDALKLIGDVDNNGKDAWPPNKFERGVYAMVYPHWSIPKLPAAIQLLKDYVYQFSTNRARLILIVPEETPIIKELEHDLTILEYKLPDKEEILAIFDRTVKAVFSKKNIDFPFTAEDVRMAVNLAAGMTEMEVENAFARAISGFRPFEVEKKSDDYRWLKTLDIHTFLSTLNDIKIEAVKKSEILSLMPEAKLKDVAGLELAKEWAGERAVAFSDMAKNFGAKRPKGVLLVGPPGTGKTLFSKVFGEFFLQRVVRLDMSAVFNKFVGESAARLRRAIKMAKAMAPVILLVDEVDKASGGKDGGNNESTGQVMSTLLTEMQECTEEVFWIFTANWPDRIDPALLRAGRVDAKFSLLPPTAVEREAIFKIHLEKGKQSTKGIKFSQLVALTKGFVSSEIEAIVNDAVITAVFRKMKGVTTELLMERAARVKPLCLAFPEEFTKMQQWAKEHCLPSSIPEDELPTKSEEPESTERVRSL